MALKKAQMQEPEQTLDPVSYEEADFFGFDDDNEGGHQADISHSPTQPDTSDTQHLPAEGSATAAPTAAAGEQGSALLDDGMGELVYGPGTFPQISLQDQFQSGQLELGTSFDCVFIDSQPKYILKVSDDTFFYTRDMKTTADGQLVDDILADWRKQGLSVHTKYYRDFTVHVTTGEMAEQLAILSVPKTSLYRLSGYRQELAYKRRISIQQAVTTVFRGDRVGSGARAFYPWNFKFKGLAQG